MFSLLKTTGIPADGAAVSLASCPGKPFFLQHDYVKKYWTLAALPEDKLELTLEFADMIQENECFRMLAWHIYRYFNLIPMGQIKVDEFPDIIEELGEKSGILYLLIGLSMIPGFIARAERENFPVRYAEAGAERIGTVTCFYAQMYNGAFGVRPRSLLFPVHYRETATWRIGRFDFVISRADNTIPEVYRKGDALVAFCADGVPLKSNNDRAFTAEETVRITYVTAENGKVTGTPIDFNTGLAMAEELTIDLADGWEKVAGPGDWTLFFHIPGGGGMKPELCRESFKEALEFFKSYCPEKTFRMIWSASWIFNPAWNELLPNSNMAALIKAGHLFPAFSANNPGLYFVFGRNDGDISEFTAVNSVEKAVLQCYKENRLRRVGWFMLNIPDTAQK